MKYDHVIRLLSTFSSCHHHHPLIPFCSSQVSPGSMLEHWDCLDDQHDLAVCPFPTPDTPPATSVTLSPSSVTAFGATVTSAVSPVTRRTSSLTDMTAPTTSTNNPSVSARDPLGSSPRGPGCSELEPVSAAAHLHLLGESLSLIGHQLQETNVSDLV